MRKLTAKNAEKVIGKLLSKMLEDSKNGDTTVEDELAASLTRLCMFPGPTGKAVRQDINQTLDDLLADDVFGTEGQMDPRGDHREGES